MADEIPHRLDEIETLLETLGQSYPEMVQAYLNSTAKTAAGPALTPASRELINKTLSEAARRKPAIRPWSPPIPGAKY